ncbi:MAG: C69 family dipeptidase [Saprospiraceae bacterium]
MSNKGISQYEIDCFSVAVGRNATSDESVMLAHNEDDFGEYVFNFYKVPEFFHNEGEKILTDTKVVLDQIPRTNSYIWIDMPMLQFSDSYMNEYGVTIASDQCTSREDIDDFDDGGVGYWLRRIMAEQAISAKDAVKKAGRIVEKFGYNASGRTYCIGDPNEIWLMAIVKGRHWVAQRVLMIMWQ